MGKFAVGKDAYGISDRSGFRYRLRNMRKEWNGLLVGKDEWDPKHPQLEVVRHPPDPEALRNPRPDPRKEPDVQVLLLLNPFRSGSAGSSVITVFEPSHGRSTFNVVIFRKTQAFDGFTKTVLEKAAGYTITVIDANSYTFTVTGETATIGGQQGGGANITAEKGVSSGVTAPTFDETSVTLDATNKTFDEA
jgi:hypothetical protein